MPRSESGLRLLPAMNILLGGSNFTLFTVTRRWRVAYPTIRGNVPSMIVVGNKNQKDMSK